MKVYEGAGLGDMYFRLIRDLVNNGREVIVRGQKRLEMREPVTLVYNKPGYCWMNIMGRKFNPFFALAEVVWILTGNGNVEWISYFNSKMRDFSDGNENFHAAYGDRLRHWQVYEHNFTKFITEVDQIQQVIQKLREDPFSTQAVMSLWDPLRDNIVKSKDYPCNNLVYYSLRDGFLDQTVVIRSNDIVWGTPHNAIQFTHIHALVAGELGVEMGKLTYVIQNLHFYYDLYPIILARLIQQAMEDERDEDESRDRIIQALPLPGFCTVTEKEVKQMSDNVEAILQLNAEPLIGTGYWCQFIPWMILIFKMLKTGDSPLSPNEMARQISFLGQPLVDLIKDFYFDTKSPYAATVRDCLTFQLFTPLGKSPIQLANEAVDQANKVMEDYDGMDRR
jgi:thymidylate synthase